jgi:AcrR family transcriptional regulator
MNVILGSDQASLFAIVNDELMLHILALAKYHGITVKDLAQSLNISRPYFYRMLQDKQVRLEYILQLQQILEFEYITKDDIEYGLAMIAKAAVSRYSIDYRSTHIA